MTNKALQKLLVKNCDQIEGLVNEIYNALEDYGDDELTDITNEWLNAIEQCIGTDQPVIDIGYTLHDSIEHLNNLEE